MLENYSAKEIEAKWQKTWEDKAVFQPEPDSREKFFLTIPYGKFGHGFYRLVALLKNSIEKRQKNSMLFGSD